MLCYRSLSHSLSRAVWWDNWAWNFQLSLILWPGLTLIVLLFVMLVSIGVL